MCVCVCVCVCVAEMDNKDGEREIVNNFFFNAFFFLNTKFLAVSQSQFLFVFISHNIRHCL